MRFSPKCLFLYTSVYVLKEFLEKLLMSTKALESRNSTIDLALPAIDYILSQFEKYKIEHKDHAVVYNYGWSKTNKHYELTEKTPAYATALVLHPYVNGDISRTTGRPNGCEMRR